MTDDLKDATTTEAIAEDWATVKLPPRLTGLPMTVWITENDGYPHDARVKVSQTHGSKIDPTNTATFAVRSTPHLIAGTLPASDQQMVLEWIRLNEDLILAYWNSTISTAELLQQLRK